MLLQNIPHSFECVHVKTLVMSQLIEVFTLLFKMTNLSDDMTWFCVYIFVYVYVVCIIFLFIYIHSIIKVCSPNTTETELYKTALSSPDTGATTVEDKGDIAITLSSTPNITSLSPKKATLGRTESRKKNRASVYELSPDISDKHVQLLEKNYGGKARANRAARIIQQHFRSWNMRKTYCRLRTQSEARRTSMKGTLSKRNSMRSPSSSGSMSPPAQPIPLNLNLSVNQSANSNGEMIRTPESEKKLNYVKDEFKPIQADINIDSNFGQVEPGGVGHEDLSVRRVSEDISSIEISKNLLNDSIGQQMIINEVFQHILSPRKDSISSRSDSFRSKREEKMSIKEEPEPVVPPEGAPKDSGTDEIDGVKETNSVETQQTDETVQSGDTVGVKMDNAGVQINVQTEQVVMVMDDRPPMGGVSSDNLSISEEQGIQ